MMHYRFFNTWMLYVDDAIASTVAADVQLYHQKPFNY